MDDTGPTPESEFAVLHTEVVRLRTKRARDTRLLEFSQQLLRLHAEAATARRAGRPAFRLPDFYIIGAPRCGTTWLKRTLAAHRDILMLSGEPFAFTRHLDGSPEAGLQRYVPTAENFLLGGKFDPDRYDRFLVGEKSPDYFTMAPRRLRFFLDANPQARFILLCREPSERLWSHLRHKFAEAPDAIDALLAASSVEDLRHRHPRVWRFIGRNQKFGFYRDAIDAWRGSVPPERFLTISFHDIAAASDRVARAVVEFLGVPGDGLDFGNLPAPRGGSAPIEPPGYLVAWMRDLYGDDEPACVASLPRL